MDQENSPESDSITEQQSEKEPPPTAKFEYVKGSLFRVVHSDGAFGGLTPNGNLHISIYSERFAIPQFITQRVVDGRVGEETSREGKDWIIRELEVDIVMSLATANSLLAWLEDKIALLENPSAPIEDTDE